jgi:hypothetical protein
LKPRIAEDARIVRRGTSDWLQVIMHEGDLDDALELLEAARQANARANSKPRKK